MEAATSLPRRERERLERRRAMLDAAQAVFAEHGYDGASVDEIAERAEFGKGTLYNYFPGGKAQLFFSLFEERVFGGLTAVIDRAFADDAGLATPEAARETFRGFILALIEHFDANRDTLHLFLREVHRMAFDAETNALFARHHEALIGSVAAPIRRAIAAGALRPVPAEPAAHILMGTVRGYLLAHLGAECDPTGTLEPPPHVTADASAEFITTVLFDGLLARD